MEILGILPGSYIAASRRSFDTISVFFQDSLGSVRELLVQDGKEWTGGTPFSVRFEARPSSPLALLTWINSPQGEVFAYILGNEDYILERAYNRHDNWHVGADPARALFCDVFKPAPYSAIATPTWDGPKRVYYQRSDDKIQEFFEGANGWAMGEVMPISTSMVLQRTSIASVAWFENNETFIKVYYQGRDQNIWEATFQRGWSVSSTGIHAHYGSPLSAVVWRDDKTHISLYCVDESEKVQEWRNDGAWIGRWESGPLNEMAVQVAPYSKLSAVYFDSRIRLYMQPPPESGDIQEWQLDLGSKWKAGGTFKAIAL